MEFKKIAATYSVIVGIAMICMWTVFIINNQVAELSTEPARIMYHLVAEFLTAALLIIGGGGLLTKKNWAFKVFLISMGMLAYTVIASAGYYAQSKDFAMLAMFTVLQLLTFIFIALSFYKRDEFKEK